MPRCYVLYNLLLGAMPKSTKLRVGAHGAENALGRGVASADGQSKGKTSFFIAMHDGFAAFACSTLGAPSARRLI